MPTATLEQRLAKAEAKAKYWHREWAVQRLDNKTASHRLHLARRDNRRMVLAMQEALLESKYFRRVSDEVNSALLQSQLELGELRAKLAAQEEASKPALIPNRPKRPIGRVESPAEPESAGQENECKLSPSLSQTSA